MPHRSLPLGTYLSSDTTPLNSDTLTEPSLVPVAGVDDVSESTCRQIQTPPLVHRIHRTPRKLGINKILDTQQSQDDDCQLLIKLGFHVQPGDISQKKYNIPEIWITSFSTFWTPCDRCPQDLVRCSHDLVESCWRRVYCLGYSDQTRFRLSSCKGCQKKRCKCNLSIEQDEIFQVQRDGKGYPYMVICHDVSTRFDGDVNMAIIQPSTLILGSTSHT